jgi:hypothetical protein
MGEHLFKNWIVYVLLGGFVYFVGYLLINARREEKKKEAEQKDGKKKVDYV